MGAGHSRRSDLSKINIWYATFGSNMRKRRFLCYIKGGKVKGMKTSLPGSKDKRPPKEILWKTFTHRRLFFGREKTVTWGRGGVAFLHPERKNKEDIVRMRLYRITLEQFNDVLRQENGSSYHMRSPLFGLTSLKRIKEKGSINLKAVKKGWYRNVVYLGMEQGIPILTMTCNTSDIKKFKSGEVPLRAPSEAYYNTLVEGLVEGGKLSEKKAIKYINEAATKPL